MRSVNALGGILCSFKKYTIANYIEILDIQTSYYSIVNGFRQAFYGGNMQLSLWPAHTITFNLHETNTRGEYKRLSDSPKLKMLIRIHTYTYNINFTCFFHRLFLNKFTYICYLNPKVIIRAKVFVYVSNNFHIPQ